jgi:general secretion pathway protein G
MKPERKQPGFTLIELLVVLAVIATLLTMALPRYFTSLEKSREVALQQNLALMRESLDKYYADKGKYPAALNELVSARYLRSMPLDPITESDATWISVPPAQPDMGGVQDVRSGAQGTALDGTEYQKW